MHKMEYSRPIIFVNGPIRVEGSIRSDSQIAANLVIDACTEEMKKLL